MGGLIAGLYEDWISLDERIDTIASEIEKISEANCQRLMSVPGIGPLISTAVVAAVGPGEAFERGRDFGRDFGAWLNRRSMVSAASREAKALSSGSISDFADERHEAGALIAAINLFHFSLQKPRSVSSAPRALA